MKTHLKNPDELELRIAHLETRLENMLQLAKVLKVDDAKNLLDVEIRDMELKGVPYLTRRAGENGKTYWVPEVGEVGLLLSPAGDVGNAVFLPSLNYKDAEAPESDSNIMLRIFRDGVEEKYDGNDDTYMLGVGRATRTTKKDGKIEDATGTSKLTLETSSATLTGSKTAKISISATGISIELSPAVKIALGPTGVTITAPTTNVLGVFQVGGVPLMVP